MACFSKYCYMICFRPVGFKTKKPKEVFDYHNNNSPYPVTKEWFQFQIDRDGYCLGWVAYKRKEGKKALKFIRSSKAFEFLSYGTFHERDKNAFVWGFEENEEIGSTDSP